MSFVNPSLFFKHIELALILETQTILYLWQPVIMEGFSKNLVRSKESIQIKNEYDIQIEKTAKKTMLIESKSYNEFAGKKEAMHSMKRIYFIMGLGFVTSAFTYPLAVRLVKRVFKLKNFFNVNFAVIPIICNVNALVLGCTQGYINYYEIKQNYKWQEKDV